MSHTGYCCTCKQKVKYKAMSGEGMANGAYYIRGKDSKGHHVGTIMSKQKGKGIIEDLGNANSNADEALAAAELASDFGKFVLQDPTRVRRVTLRQDARDKRRDANIERQNEAKDKKAAIRNARLEKKANKVTRKDQLNEARFQRKLSKI